MMTPAVFEWAGALLLALNIKYSGWGFVLFLIANITWIVFGYLIGAHGLVLNQIFFTATSVLGIKRWLGVGNTNNDRC